MSEFMILVVVVAVAVAFLAATGAEPRLKWGAFGLLAVVVLVYLIAWLMGVRQ